MAAGSSSSRWAEAEDDADEEHLRVGNYMALQQSSNAWKESLDVERGQSRQRLDMRHGFVKSIIRNQKDRDAYEQAWQSAMDTASPQEKEWGKPSKVEKDGEDWTKPKHWRSFLGKEGEEGEQQYEQHDGAEGKGGQQQQQPPSSGGAGQDATGGSGGSDVAQLDWKEAQRRQAEILEQEQAEEAAAALQNQKRRSGRGNFTFTDGHPKDRRSRAGPGPPQAKRGGEPAGGSRSPPTADSPEPVEAEPVEEAEAPMPPAEPARVRKEVRVRKGFGAYAPPKRVSATLPPEQQQQQQVDPKAEQRSSRRMSRGTDEAAKQDEEAVHTGEREQEPAQETEEGKLEPGKGSSGAKEKERGRREVRVRPGFGTYAAPKRVSCKDEEPSGAVGSDDDGDEPPPGFQKPRGPSASARRATEEPRQRASREEKGRGRGPRGQEEKGGRGSRRRAAAAAAAAELEASMTSSRSLNAKAAEFKPPAAASTSLNVKAAEFKPPAAAPEEGTALNAKAAEFKPPTSRGGSPPPAFAPAAPAPAAASAPAAPAPAAAPAAAAAAVASPVPFSKVDGTPKGEVREVTVATLEDVEDEEGEEEEKEEEEKEKEKETEEENIGEAKADEKEDEEGEEGQAVSASKVHMAEEGPEFDAVGGDDDEVEENSVDSGCVEGLEEVKQGQSTLVIPEEEKPVRDEENKETEKHVSDSSDQVKEEEEDGDDEEEEQEEEHDMENLKEAGNGVEQQDEEEEKQDEDLMEEGKEGEHEEEQAAATEEREDEESDDVNTSNCSVEPPVHCESPVRPKQQSPKKVIGSPAVTKGSVKMAAIAFTEKIEMRNGGGPEPALGHAVHRRGASASSMPAMRSETRGEIRQVAESWDEATSKEKSLEPASALHSPPGTSVLEKVRMMEKALKD